MGGSVWFVVLIDGCAWFSTPDAMGGSVWYAELLDGCAWFSTPAAMVGSVWFAGPLVFDWLIVAWLGCFTRLFEYLSFQIIYSR